MTAMAKFISGDALKAAALRFLGEMRAKVESEQNGLHSIFDSWFIRVLTRLISFDPARSWEDSVRDNALRAPAQDQSLPWDLHAAAAVSRSLAARALRRVFPAQAVGRRIIIRGSAPSSASMCC